MGTQTITKEYLEEVIQAVFETNRLMKQQIRDYHKAGLLKLSEAISFNNGICNYYLTTE